VLDQLIAGRPDLRVAVAKRRVGSDLEIVFRLDSRLPCFLHWGLARRQRDPWHVPPASVWPPDTRPFGTQALQTPFPDWPGERQLCVRLSAGLDAGFLAFDLFCPGTNRWENNHGADFHVPLPELDSGTTPAPTPTAVLETELAGTQTLFRQTYPLDSGGQLAAAVVRTPTRCQLWFLTDAAAPLSLHWGALDRGRSPWRLPAESLRPADSHPRGETAVQSPFVEWRGLRRLVWEMPADSAPPALGFVLYQPATDRWLKHRGQDMVVRTALAAPADGTSPAGRLAERIIEGEMGPHGWTLMHRFHLAGEFIDSAGEDREAWATLFVWLRYSALRQLDWQRNYNTKPRELAHAQDRLTERLARAFVEYTVCRDLIRRTLACLGRGGDGQRIRDEILQIMHRHHLKEVGGTWVEQWHQKLHNNTTPDDIVICEAYLAFLHGNGDLRRYDQALRAGGVSRQRLAALERPINTNPEWHPHLKEGLLHDFGHYLMLLKSVHSGTDLATAVRAAGTFIDGAARDALGWLIHRFQDPQVAVGERVARITDLRQQLHRRLASETNTGAVKELLYLDLALEEALRTVVERALEPDLAPAVLIGLADSLIAHLLLTHAPDTARGPNPTPGGAGGSRPATGAELAQCQRQWRRLPARLDPDAALHAKAALDRLRRAVEGGIDTTCRLLQPHAETLGRAFRADAWVVTLFSEEIVRGQADFLLSRVVHHLDAVLRRHAALGDWQVVSPNPAAGQVRLTGSLRDLQGQRFEQPTVVLADTVHGDEEPPEGVCAVITPCPVDLVSHVAVRARNARLLFATCYDHALYQRLQALRGRTIELRPSPAGDLLWTETAPCLDRPPATAHAPVSAAPAPEPSLDALPMADFVPRRVGGKSLNLKQLAAQLERDCRTPNSAALPFGVFEAVLEDPANGEVAARYRQLTAALAVGDLDGAAASRGLAGVRACVMELVLPPVLQARLRSAFQAAGLADWGARLFADPTPPAHGPGAAAARCIRQVWASKWNDRAYFSRRARGFPHEAVRMAVLIQQVVAAEFAFVIHTVNPFNGNPKELYGEVVPGLGETLVSNCPGRALSFISPKRGGCPTVLAYPSKSIGLFGGGLIFRSDSNAEDLSGYAGAGLYDSVMLEPPTETTLDYTACRLVCDPGFRVDLLDRIARLGAAIERAFGAPQDIEGAFADDQLHVVQTRPQVGL
jgi:alpha-glucan,water dikinase